MSEDTCVYCGNSFSSEYSLCKHQRTAKYCIEFQETFETDECYYCGEYFDRRDDLKKHKKECANRKIYRKLDKVIQMMFILILATYIVTYAIILNKKTEFPRHY